MRAATDYQDLSIAERIQLVEDIWDSIAAETSGSVDLHPDQIAELERRLAAHRANPASAIPWAEVRERLFRQK